MLVHALPAGQLLVNVCNSRLTKGHSALKFCGTTHMQR